MNKFAIKWRRESIESSDHHIIIKLLQGLHMNIFSTLDPSFHPSSYYIGDTFSKNNRIGFFVKSINKLIAKDPEFDHFQFINSET